ncbi:MAG: hypothetical protein IT378_25385 [Sandaracinaceae bacterium]|nr:hypothetical protein [Sandaracinaceae bacterium]
MSGSGRIAELEARLAAKERTIAALARRVESSLDEESPFAILTRNAALERVVTTKTEELREQRARLETALQQLGAAQAELLQTQKLTALGQLAAGVAHEINTPVQFVGDNVTFLERAFTTLTQLLEQARPLWEASDPAEIPTDTRDALRAAARKARLPWLLSNVPRALDQSKEGLQRVSSIVHAMKEFSHPSGGELSEIDLTQLVQTAVTVARNEWKYVAELEVVAAPDMPPVPCLRDELGQVVLNLVVNAAHAIASKRPAGSTELGAIQVTLGTEERWAVLRVKDDGCGIPDAIRARVFEPFFTTKPVGMGTGQGLAITRSVVVDKHGGQIELESEVGAGTTFTIKLPLRPTLSLVSPPGATRAGPP